MSRADRFFIFFCTSPALKAMSCVPLLGAAWLTGSWFGLLLLLLIPAADLRGATLIRDLYHPSLKEDLHEHLAAACQAACAIHPGEHHYVFPETSGGIDHWRLRHLPDTLKLTVLAPKRDYAVMASREGRIFPPLQYLPPEFETSDLGCVEIYYRDIDMVELENGTMRLHTLGGREHEFPAKDGPASEAALYLRQRLRDYKSRAGDNFSA
ncbi:MAG: hypothetical protein AB7E32_08100 [Desulfovibrio sp.]